MDSINETILEAEVTEALRTCFDPEIPVNIYELGLVYEVRVNSAGAVAVKMTLTSPHCPAVQSLPLEVEGKIRNVRGVSEVTVDLVWDPPWEPSRMSEAARLELGMM
jgi:FeS assembly SUF system protein